MGVFRLLISDLIWRVSLEANKTP